MNLQLKPRSLALNITPKSPFHSMANSTLAQAFVNTEQLDSAKVFIAGGALFKKIQGQRTFLFLTGSFLKSLKILILQCGL